MEGTIDQNKLIALLLEEKLINKRQVKDALSEQEKSHKPLAQILLDLKLVTPGVLSELQARVMGMDHVKISDLDIDTNLLRILPKRFAIEHRAIPIGLSGNTLTVAMERPQDVLAIDEIKLLTGYNVRAVVCSIKDIESALQQYPTDQIEGPMVYKETSSLRQALLFTAFMVLLVLPLILVPVIASFRNEWIILLSNFDNLLMVILGWFLYGVILFYVWGVLFPPPESPTSKKSE